MLPSGPATHLRRVALAALVMAGLCVASGARAQQQESKLLDRIMHPNMDLHFDGFEKSFDTKASGRDRTANVRAFAFTHPADVKSGDGTFRARNFSDGRGSFRTASFSTKTAAASDRQALPQGDHAFATRTVDVHEDRAANKPLDTSHAYANSDKPFLVPGKRQDSIDDLRRQKNLTIDQVREILNKNR